MSENVVIDCPDCETKVRAEILAKKEHVPDEINGPPVPWVDYFLECPGCHRTIVGVAELVQIGPKEWDYETPSRVWPTPEKTLDYSIPTSVRSSIQEARVCLRAKAFSACAVMCGRALEALCKAHGSQHWQLAKGMKELKDKGIIDGRLFQWGEALRERRNIGAHATGEDVSREDAVAVLDFTIAICEYVYVLAQKYEFFKKREARRKAKKSS